MHDALKMCNVPGLKKEKRKKRMWSDFETQVRPPPTHYFPTTQGLFGSPWFWVISLSFHHWVFKTRGFHQKNLVWLGFWVMFPSLKTQNFEWWMMKTENKILVFSVSEIWVMVAKKWVMWPNNSFGVFEIKWGLGYELWVLSLSYKLWVLSYKNWVMTKSNEPLFSLWEATAFVCHRVL